MDKRSIALGIVLCAGAGLCIYGSVFPLWLSLVGLVAGLFIIGEGVLQSRTTRALSQDQDLPPQG